MDDAPIKLEATTPVLVATDVGATSKWYEDHLGFDVSLFPDQPPFAFAILCRDGVEIMIRRCGPKGLRTDGDWNVYIRMTGVQALHERLQDRVAIVEPLSTKEYDCTEFAVEDPNGFRLVFSEKAPSL
jgi:hypothetical protein